jgi:hypothetical protein
MPMAENSVVVGVFTDYDSARRAIDELKRAGYGADEIGYLQRALPSGDDLSGGATTGAVGGGVVGGIVGAVASLLIPGLGPAIAGGILAATLGGALVGAAAGGFVGVLTNMGVSESQARFYQSELEAGHTIVTVKITSDQDEAIAILRANGATHATSELGFFNAPHSLPPDSTLPPTDAGDALE